MLALFLNPGFLFIALALVAVPIIIHLINRMRFKRIRWAAMEFLLKAQKRTRRRLIIEQLLLLALRCLLIALVGLLVSRFIGCGDSNSGGKPNLHLVLLDDTLSMQDRWKDAESGTYKNCFDVAKTDILLKKIAKGLAQVRTNEQLMIFPLSKINDADYQPKLYDALNSKEGTRLKELTQDINEMQPSMVHVSMLDAVKRAEKIIGNHGDSRVRLHILSDFRHKEWTHPAGEALTKELLDIAKKNKDSKTFLIDCVDPARAPAKGGYPSSHDNVGIIDVRPSTRIVGKNMPVQFNISIKNFSGKEVEVKLTARNEVTGKEMQDVDFVLQKASANEDRTRIRLAPSAITEVAFEYRFNPEIKPNESHFAHLSIGLTNAQMQPLDNDGLLPDNLRHAVVEVRDKVPILVIDGDPKGRDEGRDSFFIDRGFYSVPGTSYDVVFGDQLTGGYPTKALERPDLNRYPTIFLLNVRDLTAKQLANLENYARDGGGVAFFLGPLVNATYYNKSLFKEGKGIFPAPLKETYFPSPNEPLLPEGTGDTFQMLTRDEKFPNALMPIFGAMFKEPIHREPLRYLQIRRYYQVARSQWKPEPGRVFELATLPNNAPIAAFEQTVADITLGNTVKAILASPEFTRYKARLEQHLRDIEALVKPGSEAKAYNLANRIEQMLNDKGNPAFKDRFPDMTEFWASSSDKVQALQRDLTSLREQVSYGDPFVIAQNYGKGKVVAVTSTAGKEWNNWAGGSVASALYVPFLWEMQNYLSSQGSEANLTVGTPIELTLDAEQFKGAQLKLMQYFMKTHNEKPSERVKAGEWFGREVNGQIPFSIKKNLEPGLYVSELVDDSMPDKGPLTVFAHAFNVDTTNEGELQRVGSDELDRELISKSEGSIKLGGAGVSDEMLLGKFNDFSESPWLFLILLLVLVAEQALAVHLSFHMKANENEMLPAASAKAA